MLSAPGYTNAFVCALPRRAELPFSRGRCLVGEFIFQPFLMHTALRVHHYFHHEQPIYKLQRCFLLPGLNHCTLLPPPPPGPPPPPRSPRSHFPRRRTAALATRDPWKSLSFGNRKRRISTAFSCSCSPTGCARYYGTWTVASEQNPSGRGGWGVHFISFIAIVLRLVEGGGGGRTFI